jgi:hypothetical protein
MTKLCIFAGTTIFSYAFWFAGDAAGMNFMGSFLLSGVGSIVGVFVGWKFAQRFG